MIEDREKTKNKEWGKGFSDRREPIRMLRNAIGIDSDFYYGKNQWHKINHH